MLLISARSCRSFIKAANSVRFIILNRAACLWSCRGMAPSSYKASCHSAHVLSLLSGNAGIRTVVLAGEWPKEGSPEQQRIRQAFKYSLGKLAEFGKRIVFVGDVPVYSSDIPTCKLRAEMLRAYGLSIACSQDWLKPADQYKKQIYLKYLLADLEHTSASDVQFVDRMPVFCAGRQCSSHQGMVPFYRDSNHLTIPGSLLALPELSKAVFIHQDI